MKCPRFTPRAQYWLAIANVIGSLPLLVVTMFANDKLRLLLTTLLSVYAITLTGLGWLSAAETNRRVDPEDPLE